MARRRILVISALVAALGAGGAWYALQQSQPVLARAAAVIPVSVGTVTKRDLPIYLTGLGTVAGLVHGRHPCTGRRQARIGAVRRRPAGQEGRCPRQDRSAALPGRARSGESQKDAGRSQPDFGRKGPYARQDAGRPQLRNPAGRRSDSRPRSIAYKASIKADDAAIETAQTNFDYTSIIAPSDGRMGVRLIDPGNIVHAADAAPIATLTLTEPSAVLFTLSARSLNDVREAMARGPVEVVALSQDNRRVLSKGTLLLIDNIVDQSSATMRLKAMFANEDEQLWPGDFVNARLLLEERHDVLTIPSPAIQRGPDGIFTWVVGGQGYG